MSKKFTFTKENIVSILTGAGIAGLGAIITYFSQWASSTDFGDMTPLVVALMSILVNAFRKFSKNE